MSRRRTPLLPPVAHRRDAEGSIGVHGGRREPRDVLVRLCRRGRGLGFVELAPRLLQYGKINLLEEVGVPIGTEPDEDRRPHDGHFFLAFGNGARLVPQYGQTDAA